MPKRERLFIAVAMVLAVNLLIILFPLKTAVYLILFDVLVTYLATYIVLLEDIEHIEWVVLFILPIYLAVSLLLFYYLLPVRWLTRIPFLLVLGVGMYASMLAENIFNVGVEKSLPLYRAAYSVSNFLSLLTFFLLFTVLYSFRMHFLLNGFAAFVISWPLLFHNVWVSSPKSVLEERVYKYATINAVLLTEAVIVLNFVPIRTNINALYTVGFIYLLSGLTQEIMNDTVFRQRVNEYIIVFFVLTALVLLTVIWG